MSEHDSLGRRRNNSRGIICTKPSGPPVAGCLQRKRKVAAVGAGGDPAISTTSPVLRDAAIGIVDAGAEIGTGYLGIIERR